MIVKEKELKAANVRGQQTNNGYNYFARQGVGLVAVQEIQGIYHVIPAERPSMMLEDPSKVIPTLLKILGLGKGAAAGSELARFLWKDWD